MRNRWLRAIAITTALGVTSGSIGCAYTLHPERRGSTSGYLDGGSLVLDILWLLPGIIPGVIALAVDFSSGAIYEGGRTRGPN